MDRRGLGASPFWHDLCKFPHDIMHAIKTAALTVSDVAVDVEQGVLHVTMVLANGMKQLMNLVIATFEDVVSAVKTAIRAIGRAVDEVETRLLGDHDQNWQRSTQMVLHDEAHPSRLELPLAATPSAIS